MMNKINVNAFCYEDKMVFPIYLSDQSFNDTLDLLLISNHYVYIKDFNRLMFNKTKCKNKKWFCKSCLQCFSSEKVLTEHNKDCLLINGAQNVKLEKIRERFTEFKNFNKIIPAPFKIYADVGCLLKNVDSRINNDCFNQYQDHIPCSFAYKLVCVNDICSKDLVLYRGKNAVIQSIFKEHSYCNSVMKKRFNKNVIMTVNEEEEFERSNICWICNKLIENDDKVRDHFHITGKYRSAAHRSCNINLKVSKKLVVIFHNLKGYDSYLIIKELNKFNSSLSVIPNGLEKYMSLSLGKNMIFIDSMLFLNSSLDKLTSNLNDFKYLSSVFNGEQLELVKKKGIYPYEYMDSFKRFKEYKLPDIDCFFISLKNCGISEEEYQNACVVWNVFEIENLGEYHDLYLKCDVFLLCDVFEKFTDVCLKDYGLDPCHYFSSPGLSWDAMLKMTGIKLEKINNIDVHLFLEKGMRGDVSYISKRYSKSRENALRSDDKTVMYWDMNNLYGTVMGFDYLPYGGFKFLSEEEIKVFNLDCISKKSLIGYILELDLEHCWNLHDLHNDYPLCPEKIEVKYDMLSKYCKDIVDWYGIKVGGVKKLIPNLYNKIRYPTHYKNLIYYLSLGMKLVKIHRILKFKQSNWLKVFTDFNTKKDKKVLMNLIKICIN